MSDPMDLAVERALGDILQGSSLPSALRDVFTAGRDAERVDQLRMAMAELNARAPRTRRAAERKP